MEFKDHRFLSPQFLSRPPGRNFCLLCGRKVQVVPTGDWGFAFFKFRTGRRILLGYVCDRDHEPPEEPKAHAKD